MARRTANRKFRLFLIKPSHYDGDGYVIQWVRSEVPSNSMAVLNSLALDCQSRQVLGPDVDIEITTVDEIHTRVNPKKIIKQIRAAGGGGLVGLVAVQSNQYPRAMDIARVFRAADIPVCIGGFHVSGTLSMIPDMQPEIQEAFDLGISLFAGEAERRFDVVLRDAYQGTLKPLYNHLADLPSLDDVPLPIASDVSLKRTISSEATVDTSRGCPFKCSFCTIINVQGRKSRSRAPEDVERTVRAHYARGCRAFFISDDDFARNKKWEPIFDRLIHLREVEGFELRVMLQVDTLSYRIPGFIDKAARAGVDYVFIGLESVNAKSLLSAGKKQNKIDDYRTMLQRWKSIGVVVFCGYIIGFPADTPESVKRDIETLKRELPIDLAEFFVLTPLPGSADHKNLYEKGAWLEPDLNCYDTEQVCAEHPTMTKEAWSETYRQAWLSFLTFEHIETVIRRAVATGCPAAKTAGILLFARVSVLLDGVHPLQAGLFRRKRRLDRRPGMPVESPWIFYPRYLWETASKTVRLLSQAWQVYRIYRRIQRDPQKHSYQDLALMPVQEEAPTVPEEVATLTRFAS